MTKIRAKKDLYNNGKCFTEGNIYTVKRDIHTESTLIDLITTNDLGESHSIGGWWREFEIVN